MTDRDNEICSDAMNEREKAHKRMNTLREKIADFIAQARISPEIPKERVADKILEIVREALPKKIGANHADYNVG